MTAKSTGGSKGAEATEAVRLVQEIRELQPMAAGDPEMENRVGLLLMLVGLTWFLIDLQFLPSAAAYTIANLLGIVTYGFLGHLVLAFGADGGHGVNRVGVSGWLREQPADSPGAMGLIRAGLGSIPPGRAVRHSH